MKEKKNVVLTDFEPGEGWAFLKALKETTGEEWTEWQCIANKFHGKLTNLWRFALYFLFPLKVFMSRGDYANIIGWQQFYGLNFAFWSRLFKSKKACNLLIMTFIYRHRGGWKGHLYFRYMRYIVTSKYIDRFVCFSKKECEYYSSLFGVSKEKFEYVPLGIDTDGIQETEKGDYIFTTGRSNRDYDFLVEALKGTEEKLVIACDSYHGLEVDNTEVDRDCFGKKMRERMAKSFCVVVPFKDSKISAGQLVVLQAMELGKPVIVTESDGIADYMQQGKNGYSVSKTSEAIKKAILDLKNNPRIYEEISTYSKQYFSEHYTVSAMGRNIGSIIKEI